MQASDWLSLEAILAIVGFFGVGIAGPLRSYLLPEFIENVSKKEAALQLDYLFVINAWVAACVSLLTKAQQLPSDIIFIGCMIVMLGMFIRLLSFRARAYIELQPWVRLLFRSVPVVVVVLLL